MSVEKYGFGREFLQFTGQKVTYQGTRPVPAEFTAIRDYPLQTF